MLADMSRRKSHGRTIFLAGESEEGDPGEYVGRQRAGATPSPRCHGVIPVSGIPPPPPRSSPPARPRRKTRAARAWSGPRRSSVRGWPRPGRDWRHRRYAATGGGARRGALAPRKGGMSARRRVRAGHDVSARDPGTRAGWRLRSEPPRLVHQIHQRGPGGEGAGVGGQHRVAPLVELRPIARGMRRDQDPGQDPQRMIGGQRFGLENV